MAEANGQGGILGRQVELAEVLDDQLVPDRAVQNMRRILDNKDIVGLMCPSGSGPTLAIVDMVAADGRPAINPQAQTPSIVYPNGADKPPRPNIFSVSISNTVEAEKLAVVLAGFSRIGIVHESTGYGVTGAELVKKDILARRRDARITVESYNQRAQDMTAQLVRVQRAGAEAMLVIGLGADFAVIRRNMSRLNINLALFGTTGAVTVPYLEGAGDLVVGTKAASYIVMGRRPMPPATQKFCRSLPRQIRHRSLVWPGCRQSAGLARRHRGLRLRLHRPDDGRHPPRRQHRQGGDHPRAGRHQGLCRRLGARHQLHPAAAYRAAR